MTPGSPPDLLKGTTPGPWDTPVAVLGPERRRALKRAMLFIYPKRPETREQMTRPIAVVMDDPSGIVAELFGPDEYQVNARLIAAAPTLARRCEELEALVSDLLGSEKHTPPAWWADRAEALLAETLDASSGAASVPRRSSPGSGGA